MVDVISFYHRGSLREVNIVSLQKGAKCDSSSAEVQNKGLIQTLTRQYQ